MQYPETETGIDIRHVTHYDFVTMKNEPSLAALLREFYERSPFKSINDLTQAAQAHAPMSKSYVAHMLRGARQNPAYDKLVAIARALELDRQDTNRLLESAGLPPAVTQPPAEFERVQAALQQLADTPGLSPAALKMIVDGLVLMIDGIRAGHSGTAAATPETAPLLRPLPAAALSPEEGMIDDLLGDILAQESDHPLDTLFAALTDVARGERWEAKRRIAETLPRLVKLQPIAAMRLADILRSDYHPDYRADIRRRVIEALPALYRQRPQEALQLLAPREQDEVYTAMAAVEALHDLESSGALAAEVAESYYRGLRLDEPLHQQAIAYLRQLLRLSQQTPDAALDDMDQNRTHPERIIKIVILRVAPRLLASRPEPALDLMAYFLRRDEADRPVEHQNLRRPISKALPQIFGQLANASKVLYEKIGRLLRALAQDPDIHVRRALADSLDQLTMLDVNLATDVMDSMIQDQDAYVRQRTWRVLLKLTELYPEQADQVYARLLTPSVLGGNDG